MESALVALKSEFGSESVIVDKLDDHIIHGKELSVPNRNSFRCSVAQVTQESNTLYPFPNLGSVCSGYNVTVQIQSNSLPSGKKPESCAESLAKTSVIILGKQLRDAFSRLVEHHTTNNGKDGRTEENAEKRDEVKTFTIPIQSTPRRVKKVETSSSATSSSSSLHSIMVSSQSDRVTVVFPIDFEDEFDKALARLYLQQFERTQRSLSAKNAPICEYRRGAEPPREILPYLQNDSCSQSLEDIAGFFSFTFLDYHVRTKEMREKAAANMIMFLTYIDYHIKCSKSYIHSRLRKKKDVLLEQLFPKKL